MSPFFCVHILMHFETNAFTLKLCCKIIVSFIYRYVYKYRSKECNRIRRVKITYAFFYIDHFKSKNKFLWDEVLSENITVPYIVLAKNFLVTRCLTANTDMTKTWLVNAKKKKRSKTKPKSLLIAIYLKIFDTCSILLPTFRCYVFISASTCISASIYIFL